jgi:hypothetical protein
MTDFERIDRILFEMHNSKNGMLNIQDYLVNKIGDKDIDAYSKIKTIIKTQELARQISNTPVFEILPLGSDVVRAGGYLNYVDKMTFNKEKAERLKVIEFEDAELKLKLNKFYFKYRWIPFALSGLALIISILVAIFK